MEKAVIGRAKYGALIKIGEHQYSLNSRSKWYEIFLPFNLIYIGHEIGPETARSKIPKNNNTYYMIGWFLSVVISSILARHILILEKKTMFSVCLLLFIFGVFGVIYWHIWQKIKWCNGSLVTDYPIIFLRPKLKSVAMIVYGSAFINIIAIFFLWISYADSVQDWRIIVVMPFIGVFWAITGFFAAIPIAKSSYDVRRIKYQGREITVSELEQIIKNLEVQQNDKSNT